MGMWLFIGPSLAYCIMKKKEGKEVAWGVWFWGIIGAILPVTTNWWVLQGIGTRNGYSLLLFYLTRAHEFATHGLMRPVSEGMKRGWSVSLRSVLSKSKYLTLNKEVVVEIISSVLFTLLYHTFLFYSTYTS